MRSAHAGQWTEIHTLDLSSLRDKVRVGLPTDLGAGGVRGVEAERVLGWTLSAWSYMQASSSRSSWFGGVEKVRGVLSFVGKVIQRCLERFWTTHLCFEAAGRVLTVRDPARHGVRCAVRDAEMQRCRDAEMQRCRERMSRGRAGCEGLALR
jgi:hypothetical protein